MDRFDIPTRMEHEYRRSLEPLYRKIKRDTAKFTTEEAFRNYLTNLATNVVYLEWSERVARNMVYKLFDVTGSDWEGAEKNSRRISELLRSGMDGPIGRTVQQQVNENSALISSLPLDLRNHTSNKILSMRNDGLRVDTMVKNLRKYLPHTAETRIRLIARTETAKINSNFIEARSRAVGIPAYIWRATRDGRTRRSHNHMNNIIVLWNDPPQPEVLVNMKSQGAYHAGCIYNCRCYPAPIISLDRLTFPVRVFTNGAIVNMGRQQLERLLAA